jgi:hypothetical protein
MKKLNLRFVTIPTLATLLGLPFPLAAQTYSMMGRAETQTIEAARSWTMSSASVYFGVA